MRVSLYMITHTWNTMLYNLKRIYRFYNGQRTRFPFSPLSDLFAVWIWLDMCSFFSIEGEDGGIFSNKGYPLLLNSTDIPRSCIPRRAGVSRGNSQVLLSRSRRCIDPWHPLAPRPPFQPSFALRFSLSLSFPSALSPFATIFLFPLSSLFFLLVPRYAHTLVVTSRRQHVGEFKHLPLLHFWIVFDL